MAGKGGRRRARLVVRLVPLAAPAEREQRLAHALDELLAELVRRELSVHGGNHEKATTQGPSVHLPGPLQQ
jgi:hypothetical protein